MDAIKSYTPEQLASAEVLMKSFFQLPEHERNMTALMANSFMAGLSMARTGPTEKTA